MPPRKRSTSTNANDNERQEVNVAVSSVDELARVVVELLDHVTLRDAKEKARLRSLLTGEEVPDADEEGDEGEGSEGRGTDVSPGSGEPS